MELSDEEIERLRPKVRFKVCYHVGFACPDADDLVQETLTRFLIAARAETVRNTDASGAFLNGICRNVIFEYRRRVNRDEIIPEFVPEPATKGLPPSELLEMREAIARGLEQLPDRDRRILRDFYLEEKTKEEILKSTGLTEDNFRVVLCRAKEKFRRIYSGQAQQQASSRHSDYTDGLAC
jgi:RNA polymerase sigma-70 factor (ECF subfamily)